MSERAGQPGIGGTARGQLEARLLDLSLGGALLHLVSTLEVGAIHDFALNLEGETVWVQAEVLRSRPSDRGGYQVAVQFLGIAPQDQRQLERYLGRR